MKYKFIIIFLIINKLNGLPEPYSSVNPLPADMHGGAVPSNRILISKFIQSLKPKIVVEVGVWLGVTSFFMAAQLAKNAKLYAIDPWLPWEDCELIPYFKEKVPVAYWQFLSNCIHLKLTDKVIPVRMPSLQAAQALNINPDLIYIDGSHTEQAVYEDIINWFPKIKKGGICCGDDWTWPSVRIGVEKAANYLGVKFYNDNYNFWYFDPKK